MDDNDSLDQGLFNDSLDRHDNQGLFNKDGYSLINSINLSLTYIDSSKCCKETFKLSWTPLKKYESEDLVTKEELNTKIIDLESFFLKSNYTDGIEIFSSSGGFTLKQFLNILLLFEKIENESISSITPITQLRFYQGMEKVAPYTFRIIWELIN